MATVAAGPEIERLIQLLARLPGLGGEFGTDADPVDRPRLTTTSSSTAGAPADPGR